MKPPLRPTDEARRLDALRQYRVLDTLPERALDDLTALAANICEAPTSLIALVDEHRQWFKSKVGWVLSESPRDVSFCGHVITQTDLTQTDLFIVPDAAQDERFADNPLVTGDPHVRFYAGAPLLTPQGLALGTLCVIDCVPRHLTRSQEEALRVLSRQVMAQLELRRQTRELVESEARLFQVFRNCPVGIAIHRWSDGTFVDVNGAFTNLLGWTREEVVGRTTEEMNIVDANAASGARANLMTGRMLRDEEVAVRTRGGDVRHVLMGAVLVELRQEPHTISTFVDITERKRAEELVRISHERFEIVARATNDAVWDWNLGTDALAWNEGYQALFGYRPEETGPTVTSWSKFIHPEDVDRVLHGLHGVIARGDFGWSDEYRFRRRDGTYARVFDRGQIIHDAQGKPVRMVGAMQDVTERKQVEEALRASEARYRTLFECAPDGIVIADRESYYIDANPSMCQMLGYSREELIGLHASDIVSSEEVQHIGPAASGSSDARTVRSSRLTCLRPRCPTATCWGWSAT